MLLVQVISTSLSQKPIVSPYQRGTAAPRRGTPPFGYVLHVEFAADVDVLKEVARDAGLHVHEVGRRNDVVLPDGRVYQRRMKPSGQQNVDGQSALPRIW